MRPTKYSVHIDYLIASVIYLGTQRGWWARRPSNLAYELSLDRDKLELVFEAFPGIFRKSANPSDNGEHFYSLQARYAQRDDYGQAEEKTDIPPLSVETVKLIYDFILKAADDEGVRSRTLLGNAIAIGVALVGAVTAIAVASLKG